MTIEEIEKCLPENYEIYRYCLYKVVEKKNDYDYELLCNFVPFIMREMVYDDGTEVGRRYLIGGYDKEGNELSPVNVTDSEFEKMEWPRKYWGMKCNIAPGFSASKHIRYVLQETAARAEKTMIHMTTGWKKIDGEYFYLMPGDEKYSVELPGRLHAYGFNRDGDNENLKLTLKLLTSVAPERVMYPLVAFAFLSPLNHFLRIAGGEPKTMMMLLGKTGSKKSTLAALMLSFFGKFSVTELPMSFRDTTNSIELNSFYLKDVLACIDDYHPVKSNEKSKMDSTMQLVCRGYGNRVGRGRLTSSCEERPDRIPQGNVIITAEQLPGVGESGTARFIPLSLNHGDINNEELTEFQQAAYEGKLSSVMHQYTEFIREEIQTKTEEGFLSELKSCLDNFRLVIGGLAKQRGIILRDRLIDDLVSLRIGALYFLSFLYEKEIITDEERRNYLHKFDDILLNVGAQQQNITVSDQPTKIFIEKLSTLLDAKQVTVYDRKRGELTCADTSFVGYYDDDNYYFDKTLAHKKVIELCRSQNEDFAISEKALCDALKNENISICDKDITLKKIRIGKSTKRFLCIPKSVFSEPAERENDEEENADDDLPFGPDHENR